VLGEVLQVDDVRQLWPPKRRMLKEPTMAGGADAYLSEFGSRGCDPLIAFASALRSVDSWPIRTPLAHMDVLPSILVSATQMYPPTLVRRMDGTTE
jgi:hypothetical protein